MDNLHLKVKKLNRLTIENNSFVKLVELCRGMFKFNSQSNHHKLFDKKLYGPLICLEKKKNLQFLLSQEKKS